VLAVDSRRLRLLTVDSTSPKCVGLSMELERHLPDVRLQPDPSILSSFFFDCTNNLLLNKILDLQYSAPQLGYEQVLANLLLAKCCCKREEP
jgi:hypothetical protein